MRKVRYTDGQIGDYSIKDEIKNVQGFVRTSELIQYCDGMEKYNSWDNVFEFNEEYTAIRTKRFYSTEDVFKSKIMPHYLNFDESCTFIPVQTNTNIGEIYVGCWGEDDDFTKVADLLVQIAVKNCVLTIEKYFNEAEGIKKDPDISSAINLLLLD